jgi:hypothetical protein
MNEETKAPRLEIDLQGLPPVLRTVTYDQCFLGALLVELRDMNGKLDTLIDVLKGSKK